MNRPQRVAVNAITLAIDVEIKINASLILESRINSKEQRNSSNLSDLCLEGMHIVRIIDFKTAIRSEND